MLRSALVLSVALTVACGCGQALAARTSSPVAGDVRALALAGDALTIARQPPRGGLTVERLVAGAAPQRLLGTSLRDGDDQVFVAGSAQALAVALHPQGGEGLGSSRVFAGPAGGPLREVSVCEAALLTPPVAVAGARVAWRDGGCGDPAGSPTALTPAAVVVAAADPAVTPARIAFEPALLPVSIVLTGDGGLIGALRPSFFAVDSEVRGFGPRGAGAIQLADTGRIVAPVGLLADGTRAYSTARLDAAVDSRACPNALFTTVAASPQRRALDAGGCLIGADTPSGPSAARVAGDRIVALVSEPLAAGGGGHPPLVSLVSMRADGGDRRVHAQGSYRPPLGLAVDGDRLAYWHERCAPPGSSEVVVLDGVRQDAVPAAIESCRATVLTRTARVRDGRIAVQLRCPSGCSGVALDAAGEFPQRLRSFAFGRGSHTMAVTPPRAALRRGRLALELAVEAGPQRSALIRLRR